MVVIRKGQMAAFEKTGLARFEAWVLDHLQEHFPKPCELAGEDQVRKLIRMGIAASAESGLETRHEICLYTDLMVLLGCGFATDPQFPWAADLLRKDHQPNATLRIDATYDRAMQYLDAVVGQGNVFPVAVLRRARHYKLDALRGRFVGNVVRDAMGFFAELWPQKHSYVGEAALGRLVAQGYKSARGYGFSSEPDVGVFAGFMFLLGHQFCADPMHPWASAALSEKSVADPSEKLRRMYAEGMKVLDKVAS
jgi:hypothetical protein